MRERLAAPRKTKTTQNAFRRAAERTAAVLGDGPTIRCRRDDCRAVVTIAKATQHLWDAHRVAASFHDRAKYFEAVSAKGAA